MHTPTSRLKFQRGTRSFVLLLIALSWVGTRSEARASPAGLVAAYGFGEGSGGVASDASGNGNQGTIRGAAWTSGKFGNALSFDGATSLVTVNDSPSLDLTAMTLEAWVFPTALGGWRDVVYKVDDIYFLEGSSPAGRPGTGGTFSSPPLEAPGPLALSAWTHLAATYDGARLVLYVNGVAVASRAASAPIASSGGALSIGGDALYGQRFAGKIDEVRIYDRALSAAEVQADMSTPVGGTGGDTQAPTAPGALQAAAVSVNQIHLTWTASTDNVGVTGYSVERQGGGGSSFTPVGTTSGTTFDDAGLLSGTTYSYRVRASDAAGNLSPYSNIATAATPAASGGLVAAYGFNEGSGGVASDASGNGNQGTIQGAAWTSGKFGNALSFGGATSLVTVNDSPSLDLTAMTLEAWIFPTSLNGWMDVMFKVDDIYFLEGNSPSGHPATGGTFSKPPLEAPGVLALNAWTHLAATYDGARLILYVNGVAVASRAASAPIASSGGALSIGGDSLYGQHFAGKIDEVRIYDRALSAAEVQADMSTAVGGAGGGGSQALTAAGATFIRGDADESGSIELRDSIRILRCLFRGEGCPRCAGALDADGDGRFDIADPIFLLAWQFLGGREPPPPFPACGEGPRRDEIEGCEGFAPCR